VSLLQNSRQFGKRLVYAAKFIHREFGNNCDHNFARDTFRFHANAAITMYAPLLSKLASGECNACTPPFNWAIKFSWLQRSFAENTTSDADHSRSLVM
jgi:hypothetical protein